MKVFDRIDPFAIERRERHLWLLALITIFVLAAGTALMMYPSVSAQPSTLSGTTQHRAFLGFCALATLLMVYLVDRQIVVHQLRKRLTEQQNVLGRLRVEASTDLLTTLPGFEHFQDGLAMDFRRAVATQQPFSIVVVVLKPSPNLADPTEVTTAFGDGARSLSRKLRGDDSIYLLNPGVFGIVLPGMNGDDARRVVSRLAEGLHDAAGAEGRFTPELRVVSYPEHGESAREIQEAVRGSLPWRSLKPVPAENSADGKKVG